MRVSIPLSSRKTSRRGSRVADSARQAARAATISGRSCSIARRVFFTRQPALPQRPAHGRATGRHAGALQELGGVLGQAQVVGFGHDGLELLQRRRIQPRCWPAGMRLGLASLLPPPGLQPAVDRALRDLEHRQGAPNPPEDGSSSRLPERSAAVSPELYLAFVAATVVLMLIPGPNVA